MACDCPSGFRPHMRLAFVLQRERERIVVDRREQTVGLTVAVPIPVTMVVWCRQS